MRIPDRAYLLAAVIVIAATALASPVLGDVTTWNYTADFSITANPHGAWSYGWLNGDFGGFTLCDLPVSTSYNGADYAFWAYEPASNPSPGVILGTVPMDYEPGPDYGGAYILPGGYLNSPYNTAKPDVRWTAPVAARIQVAATFKGTTYSGTGSNTSVLVLKNGNASSPLFSASVQGFPGGGSHPAVGTNHTAICDFELLVSAGDVIDFAASCPAARTVRDNVAFEAGIQLLDIPEPQTLTGTVTDQATGAPIEGARVDVVGNGVEALTNEQGIYTLQITPGTYTLDVSAAYYRAQTVTGVVVASSGATVRDFSMVKATEWSLADDWSSTQNPNPPWTYGRYDRSWAAFHTHTIALNYYGLDMWKYPDEQYTLTFGSFLADIDTDGFFCPLGTVTFVAGNNLDASGARWTAPYAAAFRINAVWSGRYHAGSVASEVRVLKNGCTANAETKFQDTIDGFAGGGGHAATGAKPTSMWTGLVTVAKGDTIDFVAGVPAGGSRLGATVGLEAGISVAGSEAGAAKLSDLRALKDGQFVTITEPKAVTVGSGTFADGACYVVDLDRVVGMKIVLAPGLDGVTVGDRIEIEGILGADPDGERTIFVTNITSRESGDPIGPLGAPNKSIKVPVD